MNPRLFFIAFLMPALLIFNGCCTILGMGLAAGQARRTLGYKPIAFDKVDSSMLGCRFTVINKGGTRIEGMLFELAETDPQQYQEQVDEFILNLGNTDPSYPVVGDTVIVSMASAYALTDSLVCLLTGYGYDYVGLKIRGYLDDNPGFHHRYSRQLGSLPKSIDATPADITAMRLPDGSILTREDLEELFLQPEMPSRRLLRLKTGSGIREFARGDVSLVAYKPKSVKGGYYTDSHKEFRIELIEKAVFPIV